MNLKDLEYFSYLCEYKNFTKTAEKFFISQPSITMSLKRLEKELNTKLIVRNTSNKEISLTESGEVVYNHVKKILGEIKDLKSDVLDMQEDKIKLGIPPIIGAYFFPKYMTRLVEKDLAKYVELVEDGSVAMKDYVLNDKVDMTLIASLAPIRNKNIISKILKTDEFVVCMSKNHKLAQNEKVDFKELVNEKFIVLGKSYIHNDIIKSLCEKYDVKIKDIYYTHEIETAKSLIASGVGVGIMANMAVENSNLISRIRLNESINFYVSLAYKNNHYLSKKEEKIKNIFLEGDVS